MSVTIETEPAAAAAEADAAIAAEHAVQAETAAQTAEQAAALAIVAADLTAAQAEENAAVVVADYQRDLEQCRAELASVIQSQGALSGEVTALRGEIASLSDRLIQSLPPATPETLPNPEPLPSADPDGPREESAVTTQPEPPAEPEKPERKKAHRWI